MKSATLPLVLLLAFTTILSAAEPARVKLLFLGDQGHHQPSLRFRQLQPVLEKRGIDLTYTEKVEDLNAEKLGQYAGLVIYANTTRISPEQEQALLDYVAGGKGLIPLHCASYCFLNSPKYIALVGAQFKSHQTGTFRTILAASDHPILKGFGGFESWDETYVHDKHNEQDRTVLEWRQEGNRREPWTWVRTQGKGRVFYTAWGHDERTFGNPGFHNLVERGIRWAVGGDVSVVPPFVDTAAYKPEMTAKRTDVKPFEYQPANVPIYTAGPRWGTMGEAQRQMQKPLDPAESLKHLVTPKEFEPRLFVSEPQLGGKPIFMTWDERGRLWVSETYDYPNELQPKGQGRDRIRICEDTDGDGRADKFTVFAEKLSIPTSIAFYRGGALVQEGGETIYLKDTTGDDVADLRKTLVTGWNMRDTHGQVSNFRYGPDNWYYAMQGYNESRPVLTDGRQVQSFRQGFFRFKVAGEGEKTAVTDLEFLRSTNNNTWGLGISEEGLIFGSTANGNPSEFLPIPNRYYEAVRGWSSTVLNGIADSNQFFPVTDKVRQVDHHHGFTAAAGHALYTARNYPQAYWNRTAFVTEPTGHLIATFVLRPDGAGFRSKNSWNLAASHDEWTSPIQAEVGPDGNMWFLDWYNFIIQHNPTPQGFKTGKGAAYETELRDKKHGRVYRLVHVAGKNREEAIIYNPESLAGERPGDLVERLKDDNMFWRLHAQRLLVERGQKDVVPQLLKLAGDESVDAIGLNATATHALWTLSGLGTIEGNVEATAAATKAVSHKSAGVRRAALMVIPRNDAGLKAVLASGAVNDAHPQVRLAAYLALAEMPASKESAVAVAALLRDDAALADPILRDGLTCAASRSSAEFLAEVAGRKESVASPSRAALVARVAEHYARSGGDSVASLLAALAKGDPSVASVVVGSLAKGWPRNAAAKLDEQGEQAVAGLLTKLDPAARGQLVTLAGRWGIKSVEKYTKEIVTSLYVAATDANRADAERIAAAKQLIQFQPKNAELAGELVGLINPRVGPTLAAGLVDAVAQSESPEAGAALVAAYRGLSPGTRQAALRALLGRAEWTALLVAAADAGTISVTDLSLDQKQLLLKHPDADVAKRAKDLLARGGGLPNADRQKVVEELLPITQVKGDAAAGKEIMKKQCLKCHTHTGEGTQIGPDLTGMAVHPKHELLIHILDPSRSVEGNFRVYTATLADGRLLSGLLASESKTAIELIDVEGKKHPIQREDIEDLNGSPKSLMPEGFEKQVSKEDLTNLLEFLTTRGKYLPLPLAKAATIVTTKGMFFDADSTIERMIFSDWSPKTFAGVPFQLVDPRGDRVPNAILLYGPQGKTPPEMPKSVTLPCNAPAKAIHFLSGVSGWGHPIGQEGSVTMIVRLHYADGQTEDHELKNGIHFADYIRRVDVPGSQFAFALRGQQLRYLSVQPKRKEIIEKIDLVKGSDATAPIVMAATVETP